MPGQISDFSIKRGKISCKQYKNFSKSFEGKKLCLGFFPVFQLLSDKACMRISVGCLLVLMSTRSPTPSPALQCHFSPPYPCFNSSKKIIKKKRNIAFRAFCLFTITWVIKANSIFG